ncbi:DUF2382 domain-containing protein [Pseudanabaena sp. FACHB-2040]|uniref:DUF2382 domain-containing protein n=1 Tax=Pseudanabaena sp. FACHB-2040 TaxID=2692859 RepID=UPI0016859F8F|nr:DUF2382 domain-containing protein [Pseudanabaena sp. FACHB-2040]MBD2259458.1 DUF2382 domain-containing protein [Pseudanabaena sp. FACHB-2040]
MALVKLKDFYADHSDILNDDQGDIKNFDVYAQGEDKVGTVSDILVDEMQGRIRYLIVDTGFWVFGKKVLMPIGLAQIDYTGKRVNARSLTKEQVEHLPDVDDSLQKIDDDYEEQVRGIYRPTAGTSTTATTAATGTAATAAAAAATPGKAFDRKSYSYDQEPALYNMSDTNHQSLKLYEERLVTNKQRQKTGEVAIGKRVETETAQVAIPLEKERVVIERTPGNQQAVDPNAATFKSGEVERVEVYEETPDIHKETFVRESVQVRKEVDQDVVKSNETVRREELDVKTKGKPSVNNPLDK